MSYILQPISHLIIQRALALSAAFFIPPTSLLLRFTAVAFIFVNTYVHLATCHLYTANVAWRSMCAFQSTQFLFVYAERLLIGRWNWEVDRGPSGYRRYWAGGGRKRLRKDGAVSPARRSNEGPGDGEVAVEGETAGVDTTGSGKDGLLSNRTARHNKDGYAPPARKEEEEEGQEARPSKYDFALDFLFGLRGINKPWQSKNVPPFSPCYPNLPPTRAQFLIRRSQTIILSFLILDIAGSQPPDPQRFDPAIIPLLARFCSGELTSEEIMIRIMNTVIIWGMNLVSICFFVNLLACFLVAAGLSEPGLWPPDFGALGDAWTIRRFWGNYWHQYLRITLEGLSGAVVHDVLRLPRSGIVPRYSKIFFAFAFSGCMHVGLETGGAVEIPHGAIRFFCTQVLGIVIEDAVQAQWSRLVGGQERGTGKADRWTRWVGYVWVLAFLSWSTPVFIYPILAVRRPAGDSLLPFNVARTTLGKMRFLIRGRA